jgi:putative ABC transport system permease protein
LNHRFWQRRFAGRADVVGATVQINGEPATIVGVMPPGFDFPVQEDMWMPVTRTPQLMQRGLTPGGFTAVGRLRDGATREEARAQLETVNRRLAEAYPQTNRGLVPTEATHAEISSGANAYTIWGSLWTGACVILAIACANLANLALVRVIKRRHELATRLALGAGRARIIRQILLESLLLATAAGVMAWWIARWGLNWWTDATASRYQIIDAGANIQTLSYLAGITLLAAFLLSLPPILVLLRMGAGTLTTDTRRATQSRSVKRLANVLVAVQMALAIVLLSSAGVLFRSLLNIVGANIGVTDSDHVLVGTLRLPSDKYPDAETRRRYFARVETMLRTAAGVGPVSLATTTPVRWAPPRPIEIDGRPTPREGDPPIAFIAATPAYFPALQARAASGRLFSEADTTTGAPVVVVNQSFADRFWPGETPLGKRLRDTAGGRLGEWRVVVGVVPNIMQNDPLRQEFEPIVYVPFAQGQAPRVAFFLMRTTTPAGEVTETVRAMLREVDPDVALEDVDSLTGRLAFDRDFMDAEHSELNKHATLAPVFAGIALLLAGVGLAAVVAYSVTQRTKEIGVRMAIGAAAADVLRMVVREGMMPVAAGLAVGFGASLAFNRVLQSLLVGVSPYDTATMVTAPVALILTALLACLVPARRAMRVEPAIALRQE